MNTQNFEYRFPAEWEAHKGTWLTWPHEETFGYEYRDLKESIWIHFVRLLQENEEVHLIVQNQPHEQRVLNLLRDYSVEIKNVFFYHIRTDDFWLRDNGPFFINGSDGQAILSWRFNAWGEKFKYDFDKKVPQEIANKLNQKIFNLDLTLEGGAVDFNGKGTCLTTETVLLNPNRNPGAQKQDFEELFKKYFGVTHTIWLPGGDFINDPHTDGHIDGIARFVKDNTVLVKLDPSNPDYKSRLKNYHMLRRATDQDGKPLDIVISPGGSVNFYIANGIVLVPTSFRNDAKDEVNIAILKDLFPDREVIGLDCTNLIPFGGAIHCVTQQQPLPE